VTFVIFLIVKAVVGLRVDEEAEYNGLDESQHGEMAYNFQLYPGGMTAHGRGEEGLS
jgi:Amt family ammonium transporter